MTNRDLMHAALKKTLFPYLLEQGFEGAYPHFRRKKQDCLELISFVTEKGGGSFGIAVSVAFPERKNTNLIWQEREANLTAFHTEKRYSMPGMYGGMFYYADVYEKREKRNWFQTRTHYRAALNGKTARECLDDGFVCIAKFTEDTPAEICRMILNQLGDAFLWMAKFEKKTP